VKPSRELLQLLDILDESYNRRSWHGTNLRSSIRRVTPDQAAWRPGPDRHNIWELVVHAAYWKYAVWRMLTEAPRGSFPLEGSNWFTRPVDGTEREWRDDVGLLDRVHAALRAAAAAVRPVDLARTPKGSTFTIRALVSGAAAHDLYHAGQIQLLKKLWTAASAPARARRASPQAGLRVIEQARAAPSTAGKSKTRGAAGNPREGA
jgi:hypothetical protein